MLIVFKENVNVRVKIDDFNATSTVVELEMILN